MSNTDKQQTTPTTPTTQQDTKDKHWLSTILISGLSLILGALIGVAGTIYATNKNSEGMRETNQTNKEIAVQQHQDKQEEMQLKKEEACIVKVERNYETIHDIKQKLRDYVSKIEDLHNKWILAQENPEVFSDEDKKLILKIFNDLTFIHDEEPQGKFLKDEMEMWLFKFDPSIQGYGSSFSFDTHYVVTLANISSREEISTPKTGGIPSLEEKEKAYIYFYIDFIDGKVKDCVEDNK
jgi:hypothetical protein